MGTSRRALARPREVPRSLPTPHRWRKPARRPFRGRCGSGARRNIGNWAGPSPLRSRATMAESLTSRATRRGRPPRCGSDCTRAHAFSKQCYRMFQPSSSGPSYRLSLLASLWEVRSERFSRLPLVQPSCGFGFSSQRWLTRTFSIPRRSTLGRAIALLLWPRPRAENSKLGYGPTSASLRLWHAIRRSTDCAARCFAPAWLPPSSREASSVSPFPQEGARPSREWPSLFATPTITDCAG